MRGTSSALSSIAALLVLSTPARADIDLFGRPKFHVAVGMGLSVDEGAPNPRPDTPVASYFFSAGLGDGLLGLHLRSFANAGDKQQVVRVSGELLGVVRPLVPATRDRKGYSYRVMRSFSLEVGPALERVGIAVKSRWRYGAVLGTHLDFPIAHEGAAKELRVRLGLRRMVGSHATVSDYRVRDTDLEAYAQLALVF